MSSDGRYIAFVSLATNLVAGDTNGKADVFVYDCQTAQTTRVSVATGGGQSNGDSSFPAISGDGRYVTYFSTATNLVAGDTNGKADVFVYDRTTATTTRVSVGAGGAQGNGDSVSGGISLDGRYVTFSSTATNLVSGDTNGKSDVFVYDRTAATTTRVSVGPSAAQGNGDSYLPTISGDGRYVTYTSAATNLVSGDTNADYDIFVYDRNTGVTTRESVSTGSVQGNGDSIFSAISGDGRYVTFASAATNLVSGDTNAKWDIFVRDRTAGTTTRVSVSSGALQGNDDSGFPAISGDGRYVAYSSNSTNLVSGDTNSDADVFLYDRNTGQTTRVSVASGGAQGDNDSLLAGFSADGKVLAFTSVATNLVSGDTNASSDVFARPNP